jgi:hypothetical protein
MGYNRAGWYSYDVVDMKGTSVDRIVPELQHLAVGDLVPNSPDTAFAVRVLDPGHALVLYADEKLVEEQVAGAQERRAAGDEVGATHPPCCRQDDAGHAGLRRCLRPSRLTMVDVRASWSVSGSACRPPKGPRPA